MRWLLDPSSYGLVLEFFPIKCYPLGYDLVYCTEMMFWEVDLIDLLVFGIVSVGLLGDFTEFRKSFKAFSLYSFAKVPASKSFSDLLAFSSIFFFLAFVSLCLIKESK